MGGNQQWWQTPNFLRVQRAFISAAVLGSPKWAGIKSGYITPAVLESPRWGEMKSCCIDQLFRTQFGV